MAQKGGGATFAPISILQDKPGPEWGKQKAKSGKKRSTWRNGTIYCHREKAAASFENTAVTRISCLSEKVLFELGEIAKTSGSAAQYSQRAHMLEYWASIFKRLWRPGIDSWAPLKVYK